MFGLSKYNYESFTRDVLQKHLAVSRTGAGPEPGEQAPDFEARTLDGETIRLGDYRGDKNVVLTFGSLTCPMTAGSIGGMNDLHREYSGEDVQFLFVYVREAHPGERVPAHGSAKEKTRAAEMLREEEDIQLPILVDELRGPIHRKYGRLPNPTFIIDKSGRVAFRALWTRPSVVEDALEALLQRQRDRGVEHAIVNGGEDRSFPLSYAMFHAYRALERGGEKSLSQFREALGARGRIVLASSRLAEPVALHPGKAFAAAAIAGGVVTAGLLAGRKLREKRLAARQPYDVYESRHPAARTGTDYSEPVGI
jgi:alkyl hydroperoxide reductase subunit AhpC